MKIFISPPFGNYFTDWRLSNKLINNIDGNNCYTEFIPVKGSFTLEPRDGLILQIIKTLRYSFTYKGWVNKIGLRNKGIDYAVNKYNSGSYDRCVVSIAVLKKEDVPKLLEKIPLDMPLEINVSCPNVGAHITDIGIDKFINRYRRWCIIKISPHSDPKLIDGYYNMGFRQFHCCNTVPVNEGGASGEIVRPYTEFFTQYIKQKYSDATVISGGGIETLSDINNYKNKGANYFSISTLCFSPLGFIKLLFEL